MRCCTHLSAPLLIPGFLIFQFLCTEKNLKEMGIPLGPRMKILHYISSKTEMQVCLLHRLYSPRSHPIAPRQGPALASGQPGTGDARPPSPSTPTPSLLAVLAQAALTGLCLPAATELLAAAACQAAVTAVTLQQHHFIPWP